MIKLVFEVQEVNFILEVLGELPVKSGAWPLVVKIESQGKAQLAPAENSQAVQPASQV